MTFEKFTIPSKIRYSHFKVKTFMPSRLSQQNQNIAAALMQYLAYQQKEFLYSVEPSSHSVQAAMSLFYLLFPDDIKHTDWL